MSDRRHIFVVLALTGALAIAALLGGAQRAAADNPATGCASKPICVSLAYQEQASLSTSSDHFMADSFTVSYPEGSNSTLVNVNVTVTWADVGAATTTSAYQDSDPKCTPAEQAHTLTCTAPATLRPGDPALSFGPLVFRTATNAATATVVTATASAKEQAKPSKNGGGAAVAFVEVHGSTSYEGSDDRDVSFVGGTLSVLLATAEVGRQHSKVPLANASTPGFTELLETSYGGVGGATCTASFTCQGQEVSITAVGISPVNLQIYYTGPLPSGLTKNNLVVLHDGFPITATCSGDFFVQPTQSQIPCRRVSISRSGPGDPSVVIDAWDNGNGSWIWG